MSEPSPAGGHSAPPSPRRPSAPRLLLLNALFPGLGHLVAGRVRWALILAAPLLVILVGGLLLALTSRSATSLAARLFDPSVLGVLLGLQVAILVWRLFALGATRLVTSFRPTRPTLAAGAVAVAFIVAPQLYVAGVTADAQAAASQVFQPVNEGSAWVPAESPPPIAPSDPYLGLASPSLEPSESPSASPSATESVPRVNVLLIGVDAAPTRNTFLTDTMIVASLDPVGKTVSMASIARDTVDVPLPDGRLYKGKINGLVSYVNWHRSKFPGAKDGESVLAAAIGTLLGIKLDYWAEIKLYGFQALVDSVGGINVRVTDSFCDPTYKQPGDPRTGFRITPGWYHFDGYQALAYARVRKAAGESDFTRAGRQQEVIAALRDRLVHGAFLDNPSKFLRSLGNILSTNIRPSLIADYIDVASGIGRQDVFRVVIDHPLVKAGYDYRGSIQRPNVKAIRRMAARLFTPTGVRPQGFATMPASGSGKASRTSTNSTCGITPTPKPTPKPTPTPTPTPTASASGSPTSTATPTPTPTATATSTATPTPSPKPTPTPTPTPTPKPTASPTATSASSPSPSAAPPSGSS